MDPETIRQFKKAKSFEPFEMRLANGNRHQIHQWDSFVVGKDYVAIAWPDSDQIAWFNVDQVLIVEKITTIHDDGPIGQSTND